VADSALGIDRALVVGTGLLGTSIALALTEQGVSVALEDQSPSAVALAVDYGAGQKYTEDVGEPDLVVVAVPPDVTAQVVREALERFARARVIDVASVKADIIAEVGPSDRFLGTHPMAGRERGGAMAARVDLFTGRPWVITPTESTPADFVDQVRNLVSTLRATVHVMAAKEHDRAVAMISHLPQVIASTMAARLQAADQVALDLAGQGVRDVTRIAGSDVSLWLQILSHNAPFVRKLLREVVEDLQGLSDALDDVEKPGAKRAVADLLARGTEGVSRLPGKHGGSARFASLVVVIDDRPGQLARLLHDVGVLEVNLEDMALEHSPGAQVGFVELSVLPQKVHQLALDLTERGWRIAGERR
jgi:prephenate dehydrogenase